MKMRVIATAVVVIPVSVVAFAATTSKPAPNTPPTTRQKVVHYVEEKIFSKTYDRVKGKIVDALMEDGDKYIGGPFTKGGGDVLIARQIVETVIDPREWNPSPKDLAVKVVTLTNAPSFTARPIQDVPGAWFDKTSGKWMPPDNGMSEYAPKNLPKYQSVQPNPFDINLDDDDFGGPAPVKPVVSVPGQQSPIGSSNQQVAQSNEPGRAENAGQLAAGTTHNERSAPAATTGTAVSAAPHEVIELKAGQTSWATTQRNDVTIIDGHGIVSQHADAPAPAPAPAAPAPPAPAPPQRSAPQPDRFRNGNAGGMGIQSGSKQGGYGGVDKPSADNIKS